MADAVKGATLDSEIFQSRELALLMADLIADTPATDTRVIDIHELSTIADFFVICSGENERQLRAISRTLTDELGERDIHPLHIEGEPISGWILLDFNDVMVHVFDEELRSFYRLEDRWAEAPVVVSIQ
ncbi:MAG: Ribosomal silencing factor RsfA [uncultured Thermomicrobiales bacterium]|uniref:Ribosomal silencing factor RsfS n=1 Tax=uncultured Thermomicrobiales bacterium TaxID=1645740 RepID=A0A6J4VPU9_9BACT|nr:MAG: Ribosomal silencing factor RsfA [uncultured Thermomicrobiales bacterium]